MSNISIKVTRGKIVESEHSARFCVVDSSGKILWQQGDIGAPIYPRSAMKPIQALLLIESGASAAFSLDSQHLALACASHQGEDFQIKIIKEWLEILGLNEKDLECGQHEPFNLPTHHNCSGKHLGFLTVARHWGIPTQGYIKPDHLVQRAVTQNICRFTNLNENELVTATDGCGIPVHAIPLYNLALAMARFADSQETAPLQIKSAISRHPFLLGGTQHFASNLMSKLSPNILLKNGAEGVYVGILPPKKLGIALKINDGASRAASVLMGHILIELGLINEHERSHFKHWLNPPILNNAGLQVGEIIIDNYT